MAKKKDIYEKCFDELFHICELAPGWSLPRFIVEEGLRTQEIDSLYNALRLYREQLEMIVQAMETDDVETTKIMEEGMKIHNLIIKEQLYGNDE